MAGVPLVGQEPALGGLEGKTALTSVVVFGTGAMASYFGARLARSARIAVTLAGTWREGLDAVAERGVQVEDADGSWSARPAAAALPHAPPADLALVLVKSHQTGRVAPAVRRVVRGAGIVVSLQNGLGNREILEATLGPGRVIVGATMAGATLLAPGHVRGYVADVRLARDSSGAAEEVAALFRRAGLRTEVATGADALLWRKLAVNCAINPLSALLGVPNGALLETPERRALLEAAAREAGAVASALGIDLADDPARAAVEVARLTAGNRSSMLQDLDRGAPTEVEAINGAVVREGKRLGVPTPVNRKLLHDVRAREAETAHRPAAQSH